MSDHDRAGLGVSDREDHATPERIAAPVISGVAAADPGARQFCSLPPEPELVFSADVHPERARAIIDNVAKWANGTVIHYYFFDRATDGENVLLATGEHEWRSWVGQPAQVDVVRQGFQRWQELGIGLKFVEVDAREEAEVRIGFMPGDGAWSYIGRGVLKIGSSERTMNFGWDITDADGLDTAMHEIGHTLGLPHEHQNPQSGIVWEEKAVLDYFSGAPNFWREDTIRHNILRKLPPSSVTGSAWDRDSVMHYAFRRGLIREPERYVTEDLRPAGGLSARDKAWVRSFYPPLKEGAMRALVPGQSEPLDVGNGQQVDFEVVPTATRKYNLRTFGSCDTVMALFEDEQGEPRYLTADDDSGEERNAALRSKLLKGRRYVLRVRLVYSDAASPATVMMW